MALYKAGSSARGKEIKRERVRERGNGNWSATAAASMLPVLPIGLKCNGILRIPHEHKESVARGTGG